MPLTCKSYISEVGLGQAQQCNQVLNAVRAELAMLHEKKLITGAITRCLSSQEDVKTEDLLDEDDLRSATQSCFPVVWVFINIPPEFVMHPQLEALEGKYRLKVIDQYELAN